MRIVRGTHLILKTIRESCGCPRLVKVSQQVVTRFTVVLINYRLCIRVSKRITGLLEGGEDEIYEFFVSLSMRYCLYTTSDNVDGAHCPCKLSGEYNLHTWYNTLF